MSTVPLTISLPIQRKYPMSRSGLTMAEHRPDVVAVGEQSVRRSLRHVDERLRCDEEHHGQSDEDRARDEEPGGYPHIGGQGRRR